MSAKQKITTVSNNTNCVPRTQTECLTQTTAITNLINNDACEQFDDHTDDRLLTFSELTINDILMDINVVPVNSSDSHIEIFDNALESIGDIHRTEIISNPTTSTKKCDLFLPLDQVVNNEGDFETSGENNSVDNLRNQNFRKKFLESDDRIISQIFSQTITSAGVTPTDDFCNDDDQLINFYEDNTEKPDNLINNCDIQIDQDQAPEQIKVKDDGSNVEGECSTGSDSRLIKQRPSILIDCYDDTEKSSEPCYVEPITPKQIKTYFEQSTVIADDKSSNQNNDSTDNGHPIDIDYNQVIDEIELTDIEIYKSLSNDDISLTKNGNIININSPVYVDHDLVISESDDETLNTDDDDLDCDNSDKRSTALEEHSQHMEETIVRTTTKKTMTSSSSTTSTSSASAALELINSATPILGCSDSLTAIEIADDKLEKIKKKKKTMTKVVPHNDINDSQDHIENSSTAVVKEEKVEKRKKTKKNKKSQDPDSISVSNKSKTSNNQTIIPLTVRTQQTTNSDNLSSHNQLLNMSNTTKVHQKNQTKIEANLKIKIISNKNNSFFECLVQQFNNNVSGKMSSSSKSNLRSHDGKITYYSSIPLHEDDLSNINVKFLKRKYLTKSKSQSIQNRNKFSIENEGIVSKHNLKDKLITIDSKLMCRSYGDLSGLNDSRFSDLPKFNSNFIRAKSVTDLRKFEQLPIHTGVSVRALRDSYCSLVGLNETNTNYNGKFGQASLSITQNNKDNNKFSRVLYGIKKFDMRSSFSKFDALQKKNILHVRSSDPAKAQEKFNGALETEKNCHSCGKVVFQMEQMKAEKNIWHRNCFRCIECSKQLNVDTYQSHDGILYCKPHFKALFAPKVVAETEQLKPRKHELIIRENEPEELPSDVIRASDKPDLGLEELQSLNVKERFQAFENASNQTVNGNKEKNNVSVKRSTSILSKLAKFQARSNQDGDDEDNENEDEEYDDEDNEDADLVRARKVQKEIPMSFTNMNEVKTRFEAGHAMTKEERREERKQEIQNIRSRLFMGKQAKIKEMYQQAVLESDKGSSGNREKPEIDIGDKAKSIKERFEKGEAFVKKNSDDDEESRHKRISEEDQDVFEQGISKKSRTLFLEMDASVSKNGAVLTSPQPVEIKRNSNQQFLGDDVVKCDEKVDDIKIETAEISSKFKFFETYKPEEKQKKNFRITPPREGVVKDESPEHDVYRDPDVVRADANSSDDPIVAEKSHTATKMLSIFRQMEEKNSNDPQHDGLKPLKCFTPPPDEGRRVYKNDTDSDGNITNSDDEEDDDEELEEEEEDENDSDGSEHLNGKYKYEDEFLKQAQSAERAKQLRAKFEKWESNEIKREQNNSNVNLYDSNQDDSQIESTKSIRAKFESMRDTDSAKNAKMERAKVNRFVHFFVDEENLSNLNLSWSQNWFEHLLLVNIHFLSDLAEADVVLKTLIVLTSEMG